MKVISGLLPETWGYFCVKNFISTTQNCHSHIHESTHFILFALRKVHPRFFFYLVCLVGPLNSWALGCRSGWSPLSQWAWSLLTLYGSPPLIRSLPPRATSYQARFQVHWDSKKLLNNTLKRGHSLIRSIVHLRSRPEYSWKIACWTLNTNQSINHLRSSFIAG